MNVELSDLAKSLKIGIYEHYKGSQYEVLGVAKHSEMVTKLILL